MQTSMNQTKIYAPGWQRLLKDEKPDEVKFVLADWILRLRDSGSQTLSQAILVVKEKYDEYDFRVELWDAQKENPYPLPGCTGDILCRGGEGCGRWSCPAKTVDIDYYVGNVIIG